MKAALWIILSVLLGLPGFSQEEAPAPAEAEINAAVARIKAALADAKLEASERGNALRAETGLVHEKVVDAIAKGLEHKEPLIVDAAIESLGSMVHRGSTEALLRFHKKHQKDLDKEPERYLSWVKALGRQQSKDTLDLLSAEVQRVEDRNLRIACLYAITNVYDKQCIDVLLDLATRVDSRKVNQIFDAARSCLMRLTGTDQGPKVLDWTTWWRDQERTFTLPLTPTPLTKARQATWNNFWGYERTYERTKTKDERGQDPEDDK